MYKKYKLKIDKINLASNPPRLKMASRTAINNSQKVELINIYTSINFKHNIIKTAYIYTKYEE